MKLFAIAAVVLGFASAVLLVRMRYRELTWSEYLTRMKEIE